jgi:hypothetical protein
MYMLPMLRNYLFIVKICKLGCSCHLTCYSKFFLFSVHPFATMNMKEAKSEYLIVYY